MKTFNIGYSEQDLKLSCSLPNRCPNWREMGFIKDIFWDGEDVVI
jgi:hypothetical protein